jgi:hypothetical protein
VIFAAITEADVLLKLEEEEAERVNAGVPGIHSVSPSSFVTAGLEVEDQQCVWEDAWDCTVTDFDFVGGGSASRLS